MSAAFGAPVGEEGRPCLPARSGEPRGCPCSGATLSLLCEGVLVLADLECRLGGPPRGPRLPRRAGCPRALGLEAAVGVVLLWPAWATQGWADCRSRWGPVQPGGGCLLLEPVPDVENCECPWTAVAQLCLCAGALT